MVVAQTVNVPLYLVDVSVQVSVYDSVCVEVLTPPTLVQDSTTVVGLPCAVETEREVTTSVFVAYTVGVSV